MFMRFLLLLTGLFISAQAAPAQVVVNTEYKSRADLQVYTTEYKSRADLVVYTTEYQSRATGNEGIWYFGEYKSRADKLIHFTEYKSGADLIIYFTEYKSRAGWENASKKYLME